MFEIETKVRIGNLNEVKRALAALGAKRAKREYQKDIYLKSATLDFSKTEEVLRIRQRTSGKSKITYKSPKTGSIIKKRKEIEIDINDSDKALDIFKRIGFQEHIVIEKERITYKFERFSVGLDIVKDLGTFMEVEAMVEDKSERKKAEDELLSLLKRLNITKECIEERTYLEMLLQNVT